MALGGTYHDVEQHVLSLFPARHVFTGLFNKRRELNALISHLDFHHIVEAFTGICE